MHTLPPASLAGVSEKILEAVFEEVSIATNAAIICSASDVIKDMSALFSSQSTHTGVFQDLIFLQCRNRLFRNIHLNETIIVSRLLSKVYELSDSKRLMLSRTTRMCYDLLEASVDSSERLGVFNFVSDFLSLIYTHSASMPIDGELPDSRTLKNAQYILDRAFDELEASNVASDLAIAAIKSARYLTITTFPLSGLNFQACVDRMWIQMSKRIKLPENDILQQLRLSIQLFARFNPHIVIERILPELFARTDTDETKTKQEHLQIYRELIEVAVCNDIYDRILQSLCSRLSNHIAQRKLDTASLVIRVVQKLANQYSDPLSSAQFSTFDEILKQLINCSCRWPNYDPPDFIYQQPFSEGTAAFLLTFLKRLDVDQTIDLLQRLPTVYGLPIMADITATSDVSSSSSSRALLSVSVIAGVKKEVSLDLHGLSLMRLV